MASVGAASSTVRIGSHVCFRPDREPWMDAALYRDVGATFLTGVISRERRVRGGGAAVEYEVRWTSTRYQTKKHIHYISREKASEGVVNHARAVGVELGPNEWQVLCRPYHEAHEIDDIWDDFEEIDEANARFESTEELPEDQAEVEKIAAMEFHANANLNAPGDLFIREDGSTDTKLLPKYKAIFEHSAASSFFAYLPLSFWKKVVENTNLYAAPLKQPKVSLDEMMRFLCILFYMTLVDKREYSNYWGPQVEDSVLNAGTLGLETVMTLKRFQYIRSNLCFRYDVDTLDLSRDPAARIRPLLNPLKVRVSKFVDVGRNCAVDETSIACRSRFARHLIVFNASKPTGKYHFKIYMCCCSTTWLALNFRLHCSSDMASRLSGIADDDAVARLRAATEFSSEVRKHVIEATRPLHGSKRIINTDNFYTSCLLLESLRLFGLFCRGTVRENSKHFPRCFMISKKDKEPRGATRQGVSIRNKIVAASWVDGSVVNIISNADPSSMIQVERLVSNTKVAFRALTCVIEYNQAMQRVDRFDQLRSRFSVTDGHTFRRWHKKLAMAFIDLARCNAYITRRLAGKGNTERDPHRTFVTELTSALLNGGWRNSLCDTGLLFDDPIEVDLNVLRTPSRHHHHDEGTATPTHTCIPPRSWQVFPDSRRKRECVVCRFKQQFPTEATMHCAEHGVSLCSEVYEGPAKPFACQEVQLTCWQKFHRLYLPQNLFSAKGNLRRNSELFTAKRRATIFSPATESHVSTDYEG